MKPVIKRVLNDIWFDVSHPSLTNIKYWFDFLYNFLVARITNCPDYSSEIFFGSKHIIDITSLASLRHGGI